MPIITTNACFQCETWTSVIVFHHKCHFKRHYQLKDGGETVVGKKDWVWVFSQCVYVREGVWVCLVAPSAHSSITLWEQPCTLMKPQGQTPTCTHTPFGPPITVTLVDGNLKPPKKFSSKHTDEDQVVPFICDWGGPKARLISSRGMKAYGWGFSNSPRAHNKSLEGASVLGNMSYTGARAACI